MKQIIQLFKELEFEIIKVNFLNSIVNSVIVFFAVQLVMSLFDLSMLIAIGFAGFFLIFNFMSNVKKMKIQIFEENNPEIADMLSTAKDNIGVDNVMVEALFIDVLQKTRKISSGTLFSVKQFMLKMSTLFVLSILMVLISPIHISVVGDDAILPHIPFFGTRNGGISVEGEILTDDLSEDDSIYGESKIAKLGNEELEVQINSELSKIDLSKVKDAEDQSMQLNSYPGGVEAVASEANAEQLPKESQLALSYNQKLRELEKGG